MAAIGFLVAFLPRNYTAEHTGSNSFRLIMWPKLLKFPIFWIGLAFLLYVTVQGLNPSWEYQTNGRSWWMHRIDYIKWLPTGVRSPFEKMSPWRMLIVYSSAWMTVCTMWMAFTRRRTMQLFLLILATNGLAVAALGVLERITKATKIYWLVDSPNSAFFGSFIYKNHAAAYLNLILAIICGLAGWYYLRGVRRLEKSNPSGVLAFFATFVAVAILISYARGATIMTMLFLVVCVITFITHQFLLPKENRKPLVAFALVLLFGVFLKSGVTTLNYGQAWDRLRQGVSGADLSLPTRRLATQAAEEMLADNWKAGTGAGSFRFLFTTYQSRYAKLVRDESGPFFWENAHNDIVQTPIELGLAGGLLVLLGVGYWLVALARSYFWENPLSSCLIFGVFLLVVYAWWDFPFACPTVLIHWCALWAAATMWARFEESGAKG